MSQHRDPLQNAFPVKETLTLVGVIITAYIGYLGIRSQTELPIQATQTNEARLTLSAPRVKENTNTETFIAATLTFTPMNTLSVDTLTPTATLTFEPTNTLIPTATPVIVVHSLGGNITYGKGNQWYFSTEISPIKIKIDLDQPANSCKLRVYIWDREAKQTIFEEIIDTHKSSYLAHVKIIPYGNYVLVIIVPTENQYSSCSESDEKITFEITVSEP